MLSRTLCTIFVGETWFIFVFVILSDRQQLALILCHIFFSVYNLNLEFLTKLLFQLCDWMWELCLCEANKNVARLVWLYGKFTVYFSIMWISSQHWICQISFEITFIRNESHWDSQTQIGVTKKIKKKIFTREMAMCWMFVHSFVNTFNTELHRILLSQNYITLKI